MQIEKCSPAIIKGLITQLQDAIYVLTDHKIIYANEKMLSLLETTETELEGKLLLSFVDEESVEMVQERYRRRVQGESVPNEYTIVMRSTSGKRRYVRNHVDTFKDENGAIVVIGSMKDVTDVESIKRDLEYSQKQQEEMRFLDANYDRLTGLGNRLNLLNQLNLEMRSRSELALLSIGFRGIREINDNLGHNVGDHLIKSIARRLNTVIDESEMVARVTGVQFAILVNIQVYERVDELIEEISRLFKRPFVTPQGKFYLDAYLGISIYPSDAADEFEILSHAHTALTHSKSSSTLNWAFYDESLNVEANTRMQMQADLREAIKNSQFELFYQPKISTKDQKFVGAEALIRWNKPGTSYVAPDLFIPHAELSDLILPIGNWVIREACQQAKRLLNLGYEEFTIGINISPKQFASGDLYDTLKTTLNLLDVPARYIDIEVTETVYMNMADAVTGQLEELRSLGVSLSIDDFGTGFSSLSYLQSLTFDALKIDRTFISKLPGLPSDLNLVRAILNMSKALNLTVIAEGVETEEQMRILREEGCEICQGYFFSRPMPADDFLKWLHEHQDDPN